MLKFASRVLVFSASGRYLYQIHAEKAKELVKSKVIAPVEMSPERPRVWKTILNHSASDVERIGPATPLTARSYTGQSYTIRETVGDYHTSKFKSINPEDLWAFRLAQTDCIAV